MDNLTSANKMVIEWLQMKLPLPTDSEIIFQPLIEHLCSEFRQTFKSNKPFECFAGNYIYPDFKIEPSRLIVEIDGSVHWSKSLNRDCKRDFWIEDRGYCVLHIPNSDVGMEYKDFVSRVFKIYPSFPNPSIEMFNRHKDFRIHKAKPIDGLFGSKQAVRYPIPKKSRATGMNQTVST